MQLLRELIELQHQHGWLSNDRLRELAEAKRVPLFRLEELVSFYPHFRRSPPPAVTVDVCRDVCCKMAGCESTTAQLREAFAGHGDVEVREVSCLGRCDAAPAIAVNEVPLPGETTNDVDATLKSIKASRERQRPETSPNNAPQRRWNCDPYNTSEDRFGTVRELVQSGANIGAKCIAELKAAGLKGMGGAGFPTGRKWELVAGEAAEPKYVICNADESEPGTFKDRVVLDELPHLVIEGMLLAGLTIGAERGIVFLRHEYGPEQQSLEAALNAARKAGVLGDNAAGSGRTFDIELFVSPGGYILGEETALLEALEGKRGEPRNKPPYPGTDGLWGKPTLINNVETFVWATTIVNRGADWWNSEGARGATGRKFVSVSGDVNQPGVHEIPLGTTVNELIDIAGGMKDGVALQAFLPGGASSNFLPADKADTPLDFDSMKQAGSMLGTGAVIVIGAGRDLFALATNLVRFFRNESCGKCVPCRLGSRHAVELLESVAAGTSRPAELDVLDDLGETLEQTSICGLGHVVLNPIRSMLRHFPLDGVGESER